MDPVTLVSIFQLRRGFGGAGSGKRLAQGGYNYGYGNVVQLTTAVDT
jgi:hypothetical protein